MSCKHRWYMIVLALALAAPGIALAEPECIGPGYSHRGCPRSEYSVLHYWAPYIYKTRALVHPSMLDQYPPGPYPPAPAIVEDSLLRRKRQTVCDLVIHWLFWPLAPRQNRGLRESQWITGW